MLVTSLFKFNKINGNIIIVEIGVCSCPFTLKIVIICPYYISQIIKTILSVFPMDNIQYQFAIITVHHIGESGSVRANNIFCIFKKVGLFLYRRLLQVIFHKSSFFQEIIQHIFLQGLAEYGILSADKYFFSGRRPVAPQHF